MELIYKQRKEKKNMNEILGFISLPGGWEWIVIMQMLLIFIGLPIFLVVKLIKYIKKNNAEKTRLRLEISKLADELEKLRTSKTQSENTQQ